MANELQFSGALSGFKPSVMANAVGRAVVSLIMNMGGNFYSEGSISVGTSSTVIPLGQVTTPHWSVFQNIDSINYLQLQIANGGGIFGRLYPGYVAFLPLDPGVVPYAIANTAACVLDYLIFSL